MKKTVIIMLSAAVMALSLTACDQGGKMKHEIGYLDMVKVLNASAVGKQEAKHNQRVLDVLKNAQKEAQQAYDGMPEDQRKKSELADAQILNRQWAVEQKHAREISVKAIMEATEAWRHRHNMLMVVDSRQVVAADSSADVTQAVINELATVKVSYGDLPQISIKKADGQKPATPEAAPAPQTQEPAAQSAPVQAPEVPAETAPVPEKQN